MYNFFFIQSFTVKSEIDELCEPPQTVFLWMQLLKFLFIRIPVDHELIIPFAGGGDRTRTCEGLLPYAFQAYAVATGPLLPHVIIPSRNS